MAKTTISQPTLFDLDLQMINVTHYLKANGFSTFKGNKIYNFLRLQRVKYIIAHQGETVVARTGRYGGTYFSEGLFDIYKLWLKRIPIPLLNRKEYEVNEFLSSYYGDNLIPQYKHNGFIYDWLLQSHNLLIEFNEITHERKQVKAKDKRKAVPNLFIINERSVMSDLARLVKDFPALC